MRSCKGRNERNLLKKRKGLTEHYVPTYLFVEGQDLKYFITNTSH